MNKTKAKKHYTAEFKAQAIELMSVGRPVTELAQELGISSSLLYSWRSTSQSTRGGSEGLGVPHVRDEQDGADDPRALRREIALLRQENDILKKAAVILGTKPQPNYGK